MLLTRPEMWASTGQAFDVQARGLLDDLCFLDDRDADYHKVAEVDLVAADLRTRFDGHDVRRSEVERLFGPPSLVIGKRILCYAPTASTGWIFFDCFAETPARYVAGAGRYEGERDDDPLIRSVRFPAANFEVGLFLTLYGKVLRWGPGWWIHQPDGVSAEQQAIAAQLRDIEAHDPSSAVRTGCR